MDAPIDLYEKLHVFEDNKELLEFTLEYYNIPMWLLVRTHIMIECIDKRTGVYSKVKNRNFLTLIFSYN